VVDKRTKMNLAAASIHSNARFSEIRSVADTVLRELDLRDKITIAPSNDGALMPGRGADMLLAGQKIGVFGEMHPQVIRSFGLEQPVVALELRFGEL
jgi:phenylalanyl-tRNA synthetase beta chain